MHASQIEMITRSNSEFLFIGLVENAFQIIGISMVIGLILAISGCEPQDIKGQPRKVSDQKPEFMGNGVGLDAPQQVDLNDLNDEMGIEKIDFLHQDHFAVISLKIPTILNAMHSFGESESVQLIEWLRNQMAEIVGHQLADLEKIEKVWVVFDRDQIVINGDFQQSAIVLIVDYNSGLESDSIEKIVSGRSQSGSETSGLGSELSAGLKLRELSPNRLAIASEQQLAKLGDLTKLNMELIRMLQETDANADIQGALAIRPIRRSLESILGLMARFGDTGQSLARLPEVLQGGSWNLFLNHTQLFEVDLDFNRPEDAQQMMKLVTSSLSSPNNSNGIGMDWSSMLIPEGIGASSSPGRFESELSSVFSDFAAEIKEKDLLNYFQRESKISIQLKTPSSTKPLINAVLSDARQAFYLEARKEQLRQVASALEAYHEKHGTLPASRSYYSDPQIPDQFSWRVALLPFLGEQELYQRFNFSEPWDSPHNLEVAQSIPQVFSIANTMAQTPAEDRNDDSSAGNSKARVPQSCFQIIEGATAVYRIDRVTPRLDEIQDERTRTAIVLDLGIEFASAWTDPTPVFLESLDFSSIENIGNSGAAGIFLIDAKFKPRHLIKDPKNVSIMLSSERGEGISRTAFLPF